MEENKETRTGAEESNVPTGTEKNGNTAGSENGKTYSEEEVNRIIEKRLARERKKYSEMITGASDDREADLIAREKAVTARELKAGAREKLADAGLPVEESLELLDYTDEESCTKSIERLAKAVKAATSSRVGHILKGGAPMKKAPQGGADPIAEAFRPPRMTM